MPERRANRVLRGTALAAVLAALLVAASACGGKKAPGGTSSGGPPSTAPTTAAALLKLPTTSPAAKGPVGAVTWGLYRAPYTLDPATSFDYPENTVVATLCDSLLRQQPDGSIAPGLATPAFTTPTTLVLNLHPGVKFWDGKPLTPADVVFSLEHQLDPDVAGFYTQVFERVAKNGFVVSGPHQVTIKLTRPDYWLEGELSGMAGVVIEKAYAQAKGTKYGTPSGGAMCTGPFELGKWTPGGDLVAVRNPHYWDPSHAALASRIVFKGISDSAAMLAALKTGSIDGTYLDDTTLLAALRTAPNLSVYLGPSLDTDLVIPTNLTGVLGDVRVRQALSLALDRASYNQVVYDGTALIPHLAGNPGYWGFAKDEFLTAWNAAPPVTQNLAKARKLVSEAGAAGKPLVIGTSTGLSGVQTETSALSAAASAIGLKPRQYNVSADNYINFFTDASARKHVDVISTTTYGDYADPSSLDATYVLPKGVQNYDGYHNKQLISLFDKADSTADPVQRARYDIEAEKLMMRLLPWIPFVDPVTVLVMNKRITGAPTSFVYMQAPALARVGAAP